MLQSFLIVFYRSNVRVFVKVIVLWIIIIDRGSGLVDGVCEIVCKKGGDLIDGTKGK